MAVVTVGDTLLLTAMGRMFGQRIMNTWHYRVETTNIGAVTDLPTLYTEFVGQIQSVGSIEPTFLACVPAQYTLEAWWTQIISTSRYYKAVTNVGSTGLWGVGTETQNIAGVITRRGELARRRDVGTLHVPISSDNTAIQDGLLTAGMKTALDNLAAAMGATISTTVAGTTFTWKEVLWNGPAVGAQSLIVQRFTMPEVRVMRRRTVGLGV